MHAGFHEEHDKCPSHKCGGTLLFKDVEGCSCHINPPCSSCVDNPLVCDVCGWEDDDAPNHKDIIAAPGLSIREYKPRPLDKTKIDYRSKGHTSSSMVKEGVYPEGSTRSDVRKVVDGTFGGRFEQFGGGRFKFIAYTD